ncbi:MAG: hypothetical protein ACJAQT_001111 [Akkermansiaceae bacterium]|jgi:hypothetical protein
MKNTTKILLALGLASPISAAVITATNGSVAGSDGYTWNMVLNSTDHDSTSTVGSVGSWSWEDQDLNENPVLGGNNNIGWRHQSDWIAITLTEATRLTIAAERNDATADLKLFPSFTVYQNLTSIINNKHFYENDRDLSWDSALTHQGHLANTTLGSITMTMDLPAGDYSLVLGGNSTSEASDVPVNYSAFLTAAPIPEPSSTLLALLAGLPVLARRKR